MQDEMRRMEAEQALRALVRDMLEDFPPLDPDSEFYGEDVDPAELVRYVQDWTCDARKALNGLEEGGY